MLSVPRDSRESPGTESIFYVILQRCQEERGAPKHARKEIRMKLEIQGGGGNRQACMETRTRPKMNGIKSSCTEGRNDDGKRG
jgi:hypothetical protein